MPVMPVCLVGARLMEDGLALIAAQDIVVPVGRLVSRVVQAKVGS